MTRHRIYSLRALLATAFVGMLAAACTDDNGMDGEEVNNMPCIELTISADGLSTKTVTNNATSPFTKEETEKLNNVDLFFYASGATETAAPKLPLSITGEQAIGTHTIKLDNSQLTQLFGSASTRGSCKVYAVVNVAETDYTASGVTKATATIQELREVRVNTPSFAGAFAGFAMFTDENAGTDYNEVTYSPNDRKATGKIKVKNLAAKIDLFVSFGNGETKTVKGVDPTDPTSGTKDWAAWNPANTRVDGEVTRGGSAEVYLVNGTTVVPLTGWGTSDFDGTKIPAYIGSDEYFDLRNNDGKYSRHLDEVTTGMSVPEGSDYFTESAIYSYPNEWSGDVLEQHQTYLMLKVNWLPEDYDGEEENVESDLVETYYKIPINVSGDSKNKLLHNRYYRIKVNINTLGGINFGAPLEVEASCEVLPWGDTKLNADIFTVRYLEVTQLQTDPYMADPKVEEYQAVMHNTSMTYIPYNSSHKIKLTEVKMQYYNFNPSSGYTPEKVGILTRRENGNKVNPYPNNDGISPAAFLLDDEKFAWFENHNEDPNGVVIDEENSRIVFYHSVYPLAGYEKTGSNDVPASGIYGKLGDKTYSPFFITLRIEHIDNPNYYEYISILQYPGVYVTYTYNDGRNADGESIGRRAPNGTGGTSGSGGDRLGVYINGGAIKTWSSYDEDDKANALQMGGIGGRTRTSNNNMYAIHVVQLSDDDIMRNVKFGHASPEVTKDVQFHIGDPRAKFVNNYLGGDADLIDAENTNPWGKSSYYSRILLGVKYTSLDSRSNYTEVPATAASGGAQRLYHKEESTLRYYYPTNESQDDVHAFMVAPVFRMSSGATDVFTGGTASTAGLRNDHDSDRLSRETARRRCAALQENGYPAGRWRLPTIGEMLFFRMLQKKNILPELFGKDGDEYRSHWTAQYMMKFGKDGSDVRLYEANDGQDHKWVRCVYDDWYWVKDDGSADIFTANDDRIDITGNYAQYYGDNDKRTMFVWGDKLKNNPQDQPQDQTPNP